MRHRGAFSWLACVTLVAAACASPQVEAPPPYVPAGAAVSAPTPAPEPQGTLVVAYPEEPGTWYPPLTGEAAAEDLAHLWGLPLFHVDADGALRPALAADATPAVVEGGLVVDVTLVAGTWSDGTPVTAADVVATLDALRAAPESAAVFDVVLGAEALSDEVVRLRLAGQSGRWPYLLAAGASVLPAHVLADGGLEAFRGVPPVTGGPFVVVEHEPGRRLRMAAHESGPLGAPGLRELEVAFVPDYETALGLVEDGRVGAALGYLALNPVERALAIDGVEAAAALGGTTVSLRWRPGGSLGGDARAERRRNVRDAIDVEPQVEGLLPDVAEVSRSLVPGGPGPWGSDTPRPNLSGVAPSIVLARGQEAPAFTARAVQRDLRTFGGGAELIRLEPDEVAATSQGDGELAVRREVPWPSAADLVTSGDSQRLRDLAAAADRSPTRSSPDVAAFVAAAYEEGHVLPLYRIAVAHVWRASLEGMTPSSWPGSGFWSARSWRLSDG